MSNAAHPADDKKSPTRQLVESDTTSGLAVVAAAMTFMTVLLTLGVDGLVAGAVAITVTFAMLKYRRALLVRYEARDMALEMAERFRDGRV